MENLDSQLDSTTNESLITRTHINGKLILEIDNFMSDNECREMVQSRVHLFNKAITHYPKYYRDNNRLEEINIPLSKELFSKIRILNLPELDESAWLNEKLRFCQYESGKKFTKHRDGVYYPNDTEASVLTFLLYLNDDY